MNSELARREKEAARKAATAAEQQVKRKANEREKVASRIAITESREAAQRVQNAARESEPASKAADTRAVAAGTAAAQRLADEHASEIEAAQLHKALEDSAREAREHTELMAIDAQLAARWEQASPSPEVESREGNRGRGGGGGRRNDRGGRGGRGGGGSQVNRDIAPSPGAVAEASADLGTRLGLTTAPPTPGGTAPTLSNEPVAAVEEEQTATAAMPAADAPGPAQLSSSAADERTCVVCLHGPQSHIALPCLHLIYCGGCAALMRGKPCAFCMNEVSEIKEVFRG